MDGRALKGFKKSLHVILAHRVEGESFTVLDRKVFHVLLANAYRNIMKRRTHEISIRDISALVAEHSCTDRQIVESLERLWKHKIAIDMEDGENSYMVRCNYLSFELSSVEGGLLTYSFDEILLKFLCDPQVYSFIKFDVTRSLKRKESLKLYEVMQMRYMTWQQTLRADVESMKIFLEVEDLYEGRWDHFRTRCLEPAIAEVSAVAEFDLKVRYERGTGRGNKVENIVLEATAKATPPDVTTNIAVPLKRKAARDDGTVDLFVGVSDTDRVQPPALAEATIKEALAIANDGTPIEELIEKWFAQMGDKSFERPDEKFLAFVRTFYKASQNKRLEGIDIDAVFEGLWEDK